MPTLGYWDIRGLAQPIRVLLTHANVKFDDVRYVQGDGPEFSRQEWLDKKYSVGLPIPNLPYYIDGDIKITQSNAILRHLARKYNYYGTTEEERVKVDVMLDQAMDLRNAIVGLCYNKAFESLKPAFFENLPAKLRVFEDVLGKQNFFVGDKVTVCDFPIYELLDQLQIMKADSLEEFPNLKAFLARFAALPEIKTYLSSEANKKLPINNKSAQFTGK